MVSAEWVKSPFRTACGRCAAKRLYLRFNRKMFMNGTASLLQRLFSLEGKAALITGATGGIGSVLAVAFAEAGAVVGIHGRDLDKIEQTCRAVEAIGGRAVPLMADLCDVDACRDLI